MKRRILLVDDEVAVLLTLKAILEINGFEVETAASAREARHLLMTREYNMIVTDMRMETDNAGAEVIEFARSIPSRPAIAMLTAFPVAEEDWRDLGADQMLVKPMNTYVLLQQIELMLLAHADKKQKAAASAVPKAPAKKAVAKKVVKKAAKNVVKKATVKSAKKPAKKSVAVKSKAAKSKSTQSKPVKSKPVKKSKLAKKKKK